MGFATRLFDDQLAIEFIHRVALYLQQFLGRDEDALPEPDVHR